MVRGKQTCKILKDIRRQIAEANDIEYITSECQYKGDCTVYFLHICFISEVCRLYQSFNAYIAPVIILAFQKPFKKLIICHTI